MNKILIALTIAGLTMSCGKETKTVVKEVQPAPVVSTPKNIIMIVGDGMGPTYTTAYRYFKDDPSTMIHQLHELKTQYLIDIW